MTPDQEKKLDKIMMQVSHLNAAIGGDPILRTKGIIQIQEEHSAKLDQYENDRAKVVGIAATLSLFLTGIGYFILHLFGLK